MFQFLDRIKRLTAVDCVKEYIKAFEEERSIISNTHTHNVSETHRDVTEEQ